MRVETTLIQVKLQDSAQVAENIAHFFNLETVARWEQVGIESLPDLLPVSESAHLIAMHSRDCGNLLCRQAPFPAQCRS